MAEYVEQRMEEMIPEIEELERVGLLSGKETKELIKKRKHFEYKIQKRTKQKEDFLGYIQYESNLLTLLEIRRDEIGYAHKKGQIETAIRNRINKLYKILCHRWQADVKVWLSHVDWLTKMGWKSSVSKINLRLLQVHSGSAKLWIAAAKYEFENGSAENGRQIMLRGLRFLPKSKELHREYIKFELLFVEKLMARKKILAIEKEDQEKQVKDGDEQEKDDEKEKDDEEKNEEEDKGSEDEETVEKVARKKKSIKELDDEISDTLINCDLVNLVLESAVAAIPEPEFLVSLLLSVKQFSFSKSVQDNTLSLLSSKFKDHPITEDTQARLLLEKDGKMKTRISECIKVYTEALELNPSAELFRLAFSTLKDLPNTAPNCSTFVLKQIMLLLKFGQEKELLSPSEFEFWLSLINVEDNKDESLALLEIALTKFPSHLQFWLLKLAFDVTDDNRVKKTIEAARSSLKTADREQLWSSFIQIMNKAGKSEEAYILLESATEKENCGELRVLLLERTREKGIQPCRTLYNRYHLLPPFSETFHKTMLEIELEQAKVDKKLVRTVYSALCSQFGATSMEAWIKWIQWEEDHGSVLEVPTIVCRAEAELIATLRNKFTTLREMNKL